MIEVHQLTVRQNRKQLFQPLSFAVKPHDIVVIAGANGSGKSTLLRTLATLHPQATGNILFNNRPMEEGIGRYRQAIHYLGHHHGLIAKLTTLENIQLMCYQYHQTRLLPNTLLTTLKQFHLQDVQHHLIAQLSAGQRRRLALLKCFLFYKPIWILDEPFTALDQATQHIVQAMFQSHSNTGGSIVLSTHQRTLLTHTKFIELTPC